MLVKELINRLESIIPKGKAEGFDNVGLLCGNLEREVTGILVCHDALESVVEQAIEKGLNFIVCFHPIVFSAIKSLTGKNYVEKAFIKAIENKIAIYAIHTSLDNDYFGVNYKIADQLGLENRKILLPKESSLLQLTFYVPVSYKEKVTDALFSAGAGNIGFYDECSFSLEGKGTFRPKEGSNPFSGNLLERKIEQEVMVSMILEDYRKGKVLQALMDTHPYEEVAYQFVRIENPNNYEGLGMVGTLKEALSKNEFLSFIKEVFQIPVVRYSHFESDKIHKIGVLGGSGASGIKAALASGCDAYLTGDLKYHDFFLSENKMLVCDIGHFESERFVTEQLFDLLSENFRKFAISKTSISTNPVNYFL